MNKIFNEISKHLKVLVLCLLTAVMLPSCSYIKNKLNGPDDDDKEYVQKTDYSTVSFDISAKYTKIGNVLYVNVWIYPKGNIIESDFPASASIYILNKTFTMSKNGHGYQLFTQVPGGNPNLRRTGTITIKIGTKTYTRSFTVS